MKRLIKLIGIILLIFFLALYLSSYNTSYYENKNILTEDAIKRFEKDLKEGKKINVNNYIEKEKNYNNKVSTYTLKLSNLIDKDQAEDYARRCGWTKEELENYLPNILSYK